MIIEIIGARSIDTEGLVTVMYTDGRIINYDGKKTSVLVLNPSQINYVSVAKE